MKLLNATRLNPEKITHPFQLMAAWFAMLIILVGILLTAADQLERPTWAAGFLVISSIAISLLVMALVFTMLTVFRPHLQGPKEYAEWLKDSRKFVGEAEQHLEITQTKKTEISLATKESIDVTDLHLFRRIAIHTVEVTRITRAEDVLAALRRVGFRAEIYDSMEPSKGHVSKSSHEAIWIGSRVPPDVATLAIKTVVAIWPHLAYLHISGDVGDTPPDYMHDELFFGGASSTALEYGLMRWTKADFEKMSNELTLEGFHELIRAKYSRREVEA